MIRYRYIKVLLMIFFVVGLNSCSKKPDIEYTSTYKMSGEWFVRYYITGQTAAVTPYSKILTYNTSDPGSNQIWVEDPTTWPFKSKVDVDYSNLAFKALASTPNLSEAGQTVKVYEGKIIPNQGHSKSGNVVDSIYLKVEFSDDAGTIYDIRGAFRTGFQEDDY